MPSHDKPQDTHSCLAQVPWALAYHLLFLLLRRMAI
jgi:hypothetical protein